MQKYFSYEPVATSKGIWEYTYASKLNDILDANDCRACRNGKTFAAFGLTLKINQRRDGFPILQGRKLHFAPIAGELAAFLCGATHINKFNEFGCSYWNEFADGKGNLKLDYGTTWRDFNGIDQLKKVKHSLANNPTDRRMLISSWRPETVDTCNPPCCHLLYQFFVSSNYLHTLCYHRSADMMLGFPCDVASIALLNNLLANEMGLLPGELTFMIGDAHIYVDHLEGLDSYLKAVRESRFNPVRLELDTMATTDSFSPQQARLLNYKPVQTIKLELLV